MSRGVWVGDKIPIEAVGYVGSAALVLALVAVGFVRRRHEEAGTRWWLVGSLIIGAWMIWLGGPLLAAFARLPVVGNNSIARAQSVVGFVVACLVGLGFDRLTRTSGSAAVDVEAAREVGPTRTGSMRPVVVAVSAGVALIGILVASFLDASTGDYLGQMVPSLIAPLLLLLAGVGLAVLIRRGSPALSIWGPVALAVLVVAQGTVFAKTMLPLSQRDLFFPQTTTHEYLQAHVGHDRYGAGDQTTDAAIADWYRLRTPTGHEFTAERWKDLLVAVDPDVQRSVGTRDSRLRSPLSESQTLRFSIIWPSGTGPQALDGLSARSSA